METGMYFKATYSFVWKAKNITVELCGYYFGSGNVLNIRFPGSRVVRQNNTRLGRALEFADVHHK